MAKLKTGDVRRFKMDDMYVHPESCWVIIRGAGYLAGRYTREGARHDRLSGERIAKILKVTPRTVTVEISK